MTNEWFLKVKKINPNGKINPPAYVGDAGYDVFAMETITLKPLERYNMPLGIGLEFPSTHVCFVKTKSGNSVKKGFMSLGEVVDSSYRGEIHCVIVNVSDKEIIIEKDTKVAQLVFLQCTTPDFLYVENLTNTTREENGFGSTGEK